MRGPPLVWYFSGRLQFNKTNFILEKEMIEWDHLTWFKFYLHASEIATTQDEVFLFK